LAVGSWQLAVGSWQEEQFKRQMAKGEIQMVCNLAFAKLKTICHLPFAI
jgi:hypothetical protein